MKRILTILLLAATPALAGVEYIDVTYAPLDTNVANRVVDVNLLRSHDGADNPPGENVLRLPGDYQLPQRFLYTTNVVDDITDPPTTNQVDVYERVERYYWKVAVPDVVAMDTNEQAVIDALRLEQRRRDPLKKALQNRVQNIVSGRYAITTPYSRADIRGIVQNLLTDMRQARLDMVAARQALLDANNATQRFAAIAQFEAAAIDSAEANQLATVLFNYLLLDTILEDRDLRSAEFGGDYEPE